MRKPRLQPVKGWNYRVFVCLKDGRYDYDDVCNPATVPAVAEIMLKELEETCDGRAQAA